MSNETALATTFQAGGVEVKLDAWTVRNYIAKNEKVTDAEVKFFIELCKARGLNPFLREVYCIKFGDNPASNVVGRDAFNKRATANASYQGTVSGVIYRTAAGEVTEREGAITFDGETLLGGWADVYVEGYVKPIKAVAKFASFNTGKNNWQKMPELMIEKVAIVQAQRMAFPEDLAGMYISEEMGDVELPQEPITITTAVDDVIAACKTAVANGYDKVKVNEAVCKHVGVTGVKFIPADKCAEAVRFLNNEFVAAEVVE